MTMVERVAKAIQARVGDDDLMNDVRATDLARAAIEAMREPTDQMLYTPSQWFSKSDPFGLVHYHNMIDAALSEGQIK